MKMLALLALAAACGAVPHVDPQPRSPDQRMSTVIRVRTACEEADPLWLAEHDEPGAEQVAPSIEWAPRRAGTGVIISERYALTAAHVVGCPIIPDVSVTMASGRRLAEVADKDDLMFGQGADVARLDIASLERYDLHIPPPTVSRAGPGSGLFAYVLRPGGVEVVRGSYRGYRGIVDGMTTRPGDSGAPVYDSDGDLVGLVVAGADDGSYTRYYPVEPRWLDGT